MGTLGSAGFKIAFKFDLPQKIQLNEGDRDVEGLTSTLRESHTPPNLSIMATRSDLLTRLKCAEAR